MKVKVVVAIGIALGALIGSAAGLGGYTFWYAEGASYMTNDPAACANCHVMQDHYDAWRKSSHHAVAVCNDCHAPHDLVGKYTIKGINGWNHSLAFTTGNFVEPFQITERNRRVTENACRHCHQQVVEAIDLVPLPEHRGEWAALSCIRCHEHVGHMTR